ncbi:hypothetical protein WJX84_001877 [Apatococcus fuscideae]|uniref:Protein kinase domain-containing protein n=1 Tax=Apatococcus fuscideae TaxID=2026836 RepID=A0AAW1TDI3_9CHLO
MGVSRRGFSRSQTWSASHWAEPSPRTARRLVTPFANPALQHDVHRLPVGLTPSNAAMYGLAEGSPTHQERMSTDFAGSPSQQLYELMAPSFSRSFSAGRRHHRRITLEHLLEHQSKPADDTTRQGNANHDLQVITPVGQQQQASLDIDAVREIELDERLGSGAFGTVFKGRWKGGEVAVKIMQSAGLGEEAQLDAFRREVQVLSALRHPHIVRLLGACLVLPHLCIVEELAMGGSLYDKLHGPPGNRINCPLPYHQVLQVAVEVGGAMAYLHPQVVHRDLKSQNVVFGQTKAKVCDFGIAKFKERTFISTKNAQAGTPAYMAPEMFEGHSLSEKIDVYSFGILLWECFTGEVPWSDLDSPMQVIYEVGVQKQRPPIPNSCPAELASLIGTCWDQDPAMRPAFSTILLLLKGMIAALGRHQVDGATPSGCMALDDSTSAEAMAMKKDSDAAALAAMAPPDESLQS